MEAAGSWKCAHLCLERIEETIPESAADTSAGGDTSIEEHTNAGEDASAGGASAEENVSVEEDAEEEEEKEKWRRYYDDLYDLYSSEPTQRAIRAGPADLPTELFANIIQYLDIDFEEGYVPGKWKRGSGLLSGSLVCREWAQRCREVFYQGRTIEISSMKQAVRFRDIVTGVGCKSLTPIADIIGTVSVVYYGLPEHGRSWTHMVGTALVPRIPPSKFDEFFISRWDSPLPFGMRLGSPNWDLPNTLPYTHFRRLQLYGVHFPALSFLGRFLRHFPRLEDLQLFQVRWDKGDWHPRAPILPRTGSKHRSLPVIKIGGCTDDLLVWQLVFGSQLCSRLHTFSPDDQQANSHLITGAYTATKGRSPRIDCRQLGPGECILQMILLPRLTKYADNDGSLTVRFEINEHVLFHLICQSHQCNTASAIGSLQVIGCVLVVHRTEASNDAYTSYADQSFWTEVLQLPHLRGLILGMARDDAHEMLASAHPELCQLGNRRPAFYRFVSLERDADDVEKGKWIARDPLSLDATGLFVLPGMQIVI